MIRFEMYRDKTGEYRWRLTKFAYGRVNIIADSAEGYKNKQDCIRGIEIVRRESPLADITTVEK